MGTDAENKKQGKLLKIRRNAWYATETKFRTFLLSVIQAGKVNELRTLVTPQPFQNDPDLLPGHR